MTVLELLSVLMQERLLGRYVLVGNTLGNLAILDNGVCIGYIDFRTKTVEL